MVTTESSWGEIDSKSSKQRESFVRMSDLVEVYDKNNYKNSQKRVRLLGPVVSQCWHSVQCERRKDDSGNAPKGMSADFWFYVPCLNYNPHTMQYEDHDCPFCKAKVPSQIRYYTNAIIRDLEDTAPANKGVRTEEEKIAKFLGENKFYLKESKETPAFTPVRVLEIPRSMTSKLKNIESTNYYMDENGRRVNAKLCDLQYGVDLFFFYNPDKEPANMYDVVRDVDSGKTPISKEYRRELLLWDITKTPEVDAEMVRNTFKNVAARIINAKEPSYLQSYKDEANASAKAEAKERASQIKVVTLDDEDDIAPAAAPVKVGASAARPSVTESQSIASISSDDDDMFEDLD